MFWGNKYATVSKLGKIDVFDFVNSYIKGDISNPSITLEINLETRSSWHKCALRDDEAVYWVIIGHYE